MTESRLRADGGARRPTVLVAMSGGVDSAVAAACVRDQGYPLLGVTMKLWDYAEVGGTSEARDGRCCSLEDMDGARTTAAILDIPYYVMDMTRAFRETVIDDFVAEYRLGRTPNPCVVCNNRIKWTALYARARQVDAPIIATGHYARIRHNENSGRYELWRGVDPTRDQSYVLWGLSQQQLACTMFPLGPLLKDEVRARARALGLPVADKAESREICFVTDDNARRFLRDTLGHHDAATSPGPIVDETGTVIGTHDGYADFTVGQRRGLGIARGVPQYVERIDPDTRTVHVGSDAALWSRRVILDQVNWVSIEAPSERLRATVKVRYLHAAAAADVRPLPGGRVEVTFDEPQRALTPGQSAVFYDAERVLGGGLIARDAPTGG